MEMMIESTDQVTHLNGVEARVWNGTTEGGVKCLVFIHRIAVSKDQSSEELERELTEKLQPGGFVPIQQVFSGRMF